MSAYSDEEFERLLVEGESDLVERKESLKGDAPTTVREAVCSFANDLPDHKRAGVVFVGVKDDGSPSGLAVTDELLRQLADIKTDGNIVPPPTLTVGKRTLRGCEVAVVSVEPSDSTPVRYKGRIHIRIGPRRGTASAQDERILSEKRRHRDRPFDLQPIPSARVGDLNWRLFEDEYLPTAFATDVLARVEITSPGGPYGAVTIESFGEPGLVDYRNPNLAEALHVLGYVQRYGFGIPTARRELKQNGNPEPTFEVSSNRVLWRVGARP